MSKWMIVMMMTLAIGCARTTARAQPAEPAEPAEAPAAAEKAQAEHEAQSANQDRIRALAETERARAQGALVRARGQNVKKEKVAWLGVSTDRVPASLRRHIDLPHKGIGLIVERVEPESPAAQGGLEQYDIIEKLNDQWLVNSEQFGVLIRMHKAGDEVSLSIFRKGQPQTLKAKLAEKEMAVMEQFGMLGGQNLAAWAPEAGAVQFDVPNFNLQPLLELQGLHDNQNANVIIKDGEHELKISNQDGEKHLVASDASGVVLFEGPIATEGQLAEVPEDIRKKLDKFDYMPGVIKLGRPAPEKDSTKKE